MKLLALFLTITSFNVFADSFEFKCVGTDLVYIDSFSMTGLIETQDNEITYNVRTRESGNYGDIETQNQITRTFKFQKLDGVNPKGPIALRFYSIDKNDKHVYINLLLDYAGRLTSQIRDANGKVFKSTCKTL
ncbi:MAG: hypothetical protein KC478_13450 [Bacteriovoracaceae bacterium]|nr:hypothetical protein [Bacteriovoracaceae bacterium]